VVYFRLNNQIINNNNETLWSTESWYTLNKIPLKDKEDQN